MQIINKLQMDMSARGVMPVVDVVQNDANTRGVEISLSANGTPWEVPEGVTACVAFCKPDGTKGLYDKLPDGEAATTISGSNVISVFVPEMLTVPGRVHVSVIFMDANLKQLATFPFDVVVAKNPAAGAVVSNNYYNYQTLGDINEAIDAINDALDLTTKTVKRIVEEISKVDNSASIICEASGDAVSVSNASDRILLGLTLYGKTTQAATPTPDAPVELVSAGDSGSIDLSVSGRNMLSMPYNSGNYLEKNGLTFTVQEDGTVIVNGTATADTTFNLTPKNMKGVRVGETYTLSGCPTGGGYSKYFIRLQTTGGVFDDSGAGKKVTPVDVSDRCLVYISIKSGIVADNMIFRPQLELGTAATEFETPKPVQTCSVGGYVLRGIPVSKNGNYTDSNGQMWLTDEIDLVNKKVIRRVGYAVFDGTEDWLQNTAKLLNMFYITIGMAGRSDIPFAYSTHFQYSTRSLTENGTFTSSDRCYFYDDTMDNNMDSWKAWLAQQAAAGTPVAVVYGLAEPVEEALSEEVSAALEGLHTNKPNTTVCSGSGAGIRVSYTADTKLYIDNKFNELAAALVNNT